MLESLFGGKDNNNIILIIILVFLLLGNDKDCDRDHCHGGRGGLGGIFEGDSIIWILILLFFIGDIF